MGRRLGWPDLLAAAGFLAVALSLAFPWYQRQVCPPMNDCGPWTSSSGLSEAGWPVVALLAAWAVVQLAIASPGPRRGTGLGLAILVGVLLAIVHAAATFQIFANTRGPLPGFGLAAGGVALAVLALSVGLLAAPNQPNHPDPQGKGTRP